MVSMLYRLEPLMASLSSQETVTALIFTPDRERQVRTSSPDQWCPATHNRTGRPAGSLASSMGERR